MTNQLFSHCIVTLFIDSSKELNLLADKICRVCKSNRFPMSDDSWPLDAPKLYKDLTFELQTCRQQPPHMQTSLSKKRYRNVFAWNSQEECLFSSHVTKNIADLFIMEDKSRPRSILVEGAPGIGKTGLTKEIAFRWASKKLLLDIKIVFVLHLRDPEVQQINNIEAFISYCSERWHVSNEQAKCAIEQLTDSEDCTGLFLIDGFDEYPSKLQQRSFIRSLINGEVFPQVLMFITSRPNASFAIKHGVDKTVEIIGFAEEEQKQYIIDSLKSHPGKESQLNEHLKELPIIKSYCRIPLNLAVLVHLVLNDTSLPETLTQLNQKFILHTIYRHIKKHNVQQLSPLTKLSDVEDPQHKSFIHNLAKLAFNGVNRNKLVFTLEEMKQACPQIDSVPDGINGLGLLQSMKHFASNGVGVTTSFNFTHYVFQEYLAAFHVSTLTDEEQYALMTSNYTGEQCSSYNLMSGVSNNIVYWEISLWNSHFSVMWSMYIGITKGKSIAFKRFLQQFKGDRNVLHGLLLSQYLMETNNSLSISEIFANKTIDLVNNDLDFSSISQVIQPHHMHSLVAFLHQNWKHYESLQLINVTIPADSLNVLHNFFLFNPDKVKQLKYLWFENNGTFPSSGKVISTFIAVGRLEELAIIKNSVDTEEIARSLSNNHTIKRLVFSNAKLTHFNISPIIAGLYKTKILVDLDLSGNCIGSKGGEILAKFLDGNPTLKSLDLSDNMIGLSEEGIEKIKMHDTGMMGGHYDPNIIVTALPDLLTNDCDHTGTIALTTALRYNDVLESLELSGNYIKHSGVEALACMLQHNTVIQLLDFSENELDMVGAEMIVNAFHTNSYSSLVSLDISSCNIGDAGMCKLCEVVCYVTNLQSLNASDNKLGIDAFKEITQMLKKNEIMLYRLTLESNNINDIGITHLASAILINKSLKFLYLRDNLVADVGAVAVSAALRENTTLESLDLSMNNISDEGACAIYAALFVNSTLKVLFVPLNPITESVIYMISNVRGLAELVKLSTDKYARINILQQTDHYGVYREVYEAKNPLYHFTVYLTNHEKHGRHVLCSMGLLDHTEWKKSVSGADDIELPNVEGFIDASTDASDDSDQEQ